MSNEKLLIDKMQSLEDKLIKIEQKLDLIMNSCNKMDNHINFVDGVYSVVKNPFYKVMSLMNTQDSNTSSLTLSNF